MKHIVTTITGSEIVTLTEIKAHLRISDTSMDDILTVYLKTAREYCETYLNRALISQTIIQIRDGFPSESEMWLDLFAESVTITKIEYLLDDTWTTLSSSNYRLDAISAPNRVILKNDCLWPQTDYGNATVKITYGVAVTAIKNKCKSAILLMVGDMEANPENPTRNFPTLADKLLSLDRIAYYE